MSLYTIREGYISDFLQTFKSISVTSLKSKVMHHVLPRQFIFRHYFRYSYCPAFGPIFNIVSPDPPRFTPAFKKGYISDFIYKVQNQNIQKLHMSFSCLQSKSAIRYITFYIGTILAMNNLEYFVIFLLLLNPNVNS